MLKLSRAILSECRGSRGLLMLTANSWWLVVNSWGAYCYFLDACWYFLEDYYQFFNLHLAQPCVQLTLSFFQLYMWICFSFIDG